MFIDLFMILWLATAADTAAASDGLTIDCDGSVGVEGSLCHMYQAIEAFSFINWLLRKYKHIPRLDPCKVANCRPLKCSAILFCHAFRFHGYCV